MYSVHMRVSSGQNPLAKLVREVVKSRMKVVAQPKHIHLIHPHLSEGEGHSLLYIRPLLILLLQHVAREEGGGGHRVVLLYKI